MSKIIAFGEIIWDVYENESLIGGAGLNFAAHCTRCGLESYMLSAVGDDSLGAEAVKKAEAWGVRSRLISKNGKQTGRCLVTLDRDAKPCFNVLTDTAFDNIVLSAEDVAEIKNLHIDSIYFGTLIQRGRVSRATLRQLLKECYFRNIICDVNLRDNCYDADSAEFCLSNATILKVSIDEEPLLRKMDLYNVSGDSREDIARSICEKFGNIEYFILTLGGEGSLVYDVRSDKFYIEKANEVDVVSTVGAGDSFIAAWTAAYLSGESVKTACSRANILSGFVVSRADAIPDYSFNGGILNA